MGRVGNVAVAYDGGERATKQANGTSQVNDPESILLHGC